MKAAASDVIADLQNVGSPLKAEHSLRFFRTGPGEYGEGDQFIGVTVPEQRKVARRYRDLPITEVSILLKHPIHECRLTALFILTDRFKRGSDQEKETIAELYLQNTRYVNNWDLVDSSAHFILGPWLETRDRSFLDQLAASSRLWDQRIAMLACYHYIRHNDFTDALRIADALVNHPHDLIHKAVGWMLREVGNRDISVEERFLIPRYRTMPRTMLRYAIEKFPEERRKAYLAGTAG